jgi:hypothetical protein
LKNVLAPFPGSSDEEDYEHQRILVNPVPTESFRGSQEEEIGLHMYGNDKYKRKAKFQYKRFV